MVLEEAQARCFKEKACSFHFNFISILSTVFKGNCFPVCDRWHWHSNIAHWSNVTVMTSKYSHSKTYFQRGSTVCAVITQENMINNEGIIVLCCPEGMILGFTVPVRSLPSTAGNTNDKNVLIFISVFKSSLPRLCYSSADRTSLPQRGTMLTVFLPANCCILVSIRQQSLSWNSSLNEGLSLFYRWSLRLNLYWFAQWCKGSWCPGGEVKSCL